MVDATVFPGLLNIIREQVIIDVTTGRISGVSPNMSLVVAKVCKYFNVTPYQLKSKTRTHNIVQARIIVAHHMRYRGGLPLSKIGKVLGGRHHSTVIYNLHLYDDLLKFNKEFQKTVKTINL